MNLGILLFGNLGPYEGGKPDATFSFTDGDFVKIATGKMNPQIAFMRYYYCLVLYCSDFLKMSQMHAGSSKSSRVVYFWRIRHECDHIFSELEQHKFYLPFSVVRILCFGTLKVSSFFW